MATVSFTKRGQGKPVVLIHGFPFNKLIWENFANELSAFATVYAIDLPGFGESEALKSPFSIYDVARVLNTWVAENKIDHPVIVGHSLGGYVALAMADLQPQLSSSLVLFHSTAYPDSEEKKQNRDKTVDFISKNGVLAFTSNFIPPLFADKEHPSIAPVREIATKAGEQAVKGYLIAMRDRKDQSSLLKDFPTPIMIIAGDKDPGIPTDSARRMASLSKNIRLHILPEVAHMGMFENPNETLGLIRGFIGSK